MTAAIVVVSVLLYLVIGLYVSRTYHRLERDKNDADWFEIAIAAACIVFIWPILYVMYAFYKTVKWWYYK